MTQPVVWEMAFADSEVRAVQRHGADVHLLFSAVSATQLLPSGERVSGYLQGVSLVLLQCAPVLALDGLFGRLRSGRVRLHAGESLVVMAVPGARQQPLTLELEPAQGDLRVVHALGLACRLEPGGVFRESLFC